MQNDRGLIERLASNDETAINELLALYGEKLLDVAVAIVGSEDLAQDVVQELFCNLWDIRAQLDIRTSIAAYLYRSVRNRALNLRKHESAHMSLEARLHASYDNDEPSVPNDGEVSILNAEFGPVIQRALSELSPKVREVFLLRVQHELSYHEIAEALGIAVTSVHQQMYRATTELARKLDLRSHRED